MAIHQHRNQALLNRLGVCEQPWRLDSSGEEPDLHRWTRQEGLLDAGGQPTPGSEGVGLDLSPVRASPDGQVFARRLTFDAAGLLAAVGPERLLFKAGSAVFAPTAGGVTPKGSAAYGERDEFYSRTSLGLEARTDFRPDSETPLMRSDAAGENVELKPGEEA